VDCGSALLAQKSPWSIAQAKEGLNSVMNEARRLGVVGTEETLTDLVNERLQSQDVESPERDWLARARFDLSAAASLLAGVAGACTEEMAPVLVLMVTQVHGYLRGAADVELSRTKGAVKANKASGDALVRELIDAARVHAARGRRMSEAAKSLANGAFFGHAAEGTIANILSRELGIDGWRRLGGAE